MQFKIVRFSSLLLFLAFTFSSSAQKKVLFEKWTNSFCGSCPNATLEIASIVEDNPNVIWISHYKPIGFLDSPLDNDSSTAIWDELGIPGVPSGMIDRKLYNNSIDMGSSAWRTRIEDRLEEEASFNVSINKIQFEEESRTLEFEVEADVLNNAPQGSYRITTYMLEDSVRYRQSSYWNDVPGHPLEGLGDILWGYPHINVVRTILEDHWGTADVIPDNPNSNESFTHRYSYEVPEEYIIENMQIVAMVSLFDEVNNYPGEIQNATRIYLTPDLLQEPPEVFSEEFVLYPNPSRDIINLEYDQGINKITIITTDGKTVIFANPNLQRTTIDISQLQKGLYILQAVSGDEEITKRFVVK